MPYSDSSNINWITEKILEIKPASVLDIGPGAGKYGTMVKSLFPDCHMDAIEIWEPYIHEFNLTSIYNMVQLGDIRKIRIDRNYDIIFLGDILEHMSEEDAVKVWEKSMSNSKYVIMSIPTIHYPQGHEHGNPYEEHVVSDWNHERVMEKFTGIIDHVNFQITSTYMARSL